MNRETSETTLPLLDLAEWAERDPRPSEWALKGFIPLRELTYLTGPGSSGKSLFGQQYATCSSTGVAFMGVETSRAPTLYVTCEDSPDELERRQKAICEALGVDRRSLSGSLNLSSLQGEMENALVSFGAAGRIQFSSTYHALKRTVRKAGARQLVLDNVAHFFGGNENIRSEVAAFTNLLNRLALDLDISILLIGHPNKAGAEWSGSTAWENQVRSRLYLKIENEDLDPDTRILTAAKANMAPKGATLRFRWHKGAFVRDEDLSRDQRGARARTIRDRLDEDLFLTCLREFTRQKRAVSERYSRSYAPAVFATLPDSRDIGKKRLEAAMNSLFKCGRIERAELWKDDSRKWVIGLRETPAGNGAETPAGNGAGNAGDASDGREENFAGNVRAIITHPLKGMRDAPSLEGSASSQEQKGIRDANGPSNSAKDPSS